ncbi:MAG TPA: hypothetical protein DIU08_03910, partial [Ktedonobacter sp.]|nr:hypothetical protein [Ktedonobacter sp.]
MRDLDTFYGPNAGYVLEQYERYLKNPASIDTTTRAIFDAWAQEGEISPSEVDERVNGDTPFQVSHVVAASALAHAIR